MPGGKSRSIRSEVTFLYSPELTSWRGTKTVQSTKRRSELIGHYFAEGDPQSRDGTGWACISGAMVYFKRNPRADKLDALIHNAMLEGEAPAVRRPGPQSERSGTTGCPTKQLISFDEHQSVPDVSRGSKKESARLMAWN